MLGRVAITCLSLVGFSCVIAGSRVAHAQDEPLGEGYFAAKLMLGIGGEADMEASAAGVTGSVDADLDLTFGGGLEYIKPLHRYFALGGLVGVSSWHVDDSNADRNVLLDIDVVPQGRFPVTDDIELSLGVPIGLTLDFWGGDGVELGPASFEVNTGVGFNIAFLFGARFVVTDGFGLLAEIGYHLHSFSHEAEASAPGLNASQDIDFSLGQFALNVGVFFF